MSGSKSERDDVVDDVDDDTVSAALDAVAGYHNNEDAIVTKNEAQPAFPEETRNSRRPSSAAAISVENNRVTVLLVVVAVVGSTKGKADTHIVCRRSSSRSDELWVRRKAGRTSTIVANTRSPFFDFTSIS